MALDQQAGHIACGVHQQRDAEHLAPTPKAVDDLEQQRLHDDNAPLSRQHKRHGSAKLLDQQDQDWMRHQIDAND